jgi:excisionase family DNA binding protein
LSGTPLKDYCRLVFEHRKTDIGNSSRIGQRYPVSEIAEVCGVTDKVIYGLIERRRLRSVKVGRDRLVPAEALEEFLRSHLKTVKIGRRSVPVTVLEGLIARQDAA